MSKPRISIKEATGYPFVILFFLAFTVIMAFAVYDAYYGDQTYYRERPFGPGYYRLLFTLGVSLCGGTFLVYLIKWIFGKPLLVISQDGFRDNASSMRIGFIPWKSVEAITLGDKDESISVSLINVDKLIHDFPFEEDEQASITDMLESNSISLDIEYAKCSSEEILAIMQEYYSSYKAGK